MTLTVVLELFIGNETVGNKNMGITFWNGKTYSGECNAQIMPTFVGLEFCIFRVDKFITGNSNVKAYATT